MNLLEALVTVRNSSLVSAQIRTKSGQAALKVIDRKIQSLLRKKAWRDGHGATPVHMGDDSFLYKIPEDPLVSALRRLVSATPPSSEYDAALQHASTILRDLDPTPERTGQAVQQSLL